MKKTILTLAATLIFGTAALAEPIKIGIAAEPYPPFASPDAAGAWVGWEVDFINAVCAAGAPLKGTCTMFTPVRCLNISPARCGEPPLPDEPKLR